VSQPRFDPIRALEVLHRHEVRFIVVGAFSAVVQGGPLPTCDLDVTPARDGANLARLGEALRELDARLRLPSGDPIPFRVDVEMVEQATAWTLVTNAGPLELVVEPAGTGGFDDLRRDAIEETVGGVPVLLASLRDVIRMKEAANRPKDMAQLPALRDTLEVIREREREGRERS
jgi:hypothetical protein